MRNAFGRALVELAEIRNDFVVLDADVAGGTGAHIQGVKDKILGEMLFEGGQMEGYIELMKASIKEEEINNIRNHTRSGRPVGSKSFIKKMELKLDRIFKLRPRGRPKKGER